MNKNLKLPWSMDDTIENLKEVKEILKTYLRKSNYEGKGESDAAEVEIDFNRAIEALEKQIPTKVLSDALIDKCGSCMETLRIKVSIAHGAVRLWIGEREAMK